MSTKNWIRVIVLTGILAWPGVETYRYAVAVRQRDAALLQQERVAVLLAQTKTAQLARQQKGEAVVPVSHPVSNPPKNPSQL